MIHLKLTQQKQFTKALFLEDIFDNFRLYQASFKTYSLFEIDGTVNADYYATEGTEAPTPTEKYSSWGQIRPIAFQIIKGKRLPLFFHIVFTASKEMLTEIVETLPSDSAFKNPEEIESMVFNIYYRNGVLQCTSATSKKLFALDQSLDHVWDQYLIAFLEMNEIEYEDM